MKRKTEKKTVVIGAGLGGLSAAISLATYGFKVQLFEKNSQVGGKLNILKKDGFSFDLGPSILTLPHYFKRLWTRAGKSMEDHVKLRTVSPHWRNFFEDGTVIDLHMDSDSMEKEIEKIGSTKLVKQFWKYLEYSAKQYDILAPGYFEQGLDTKAEMVKYYDWKSLLRMDYWKSMHDRNEKMLGNAYLVAIMDYFIKYVGSSALKAPAFMNLMPTIQFRYDLWYVEGGMYGLAIGLEKLAKSLGVEILLNQEISKINEQGDKVTGIQTVNGDNYEADVVVSNMEIIPAHEKLLKPDKDALDSLEPFKPACSGLVLHLGTDKTFPGLAHHNFVYSQDQQKHFRTVFELGKIPEDPTLYVVAPSRSDASVCPKGHDNIKILPHIPPINPENPENHEAYLALRNRVVAKMERVGFKDLSKHIVVEDMWTPVDIQRNYYSNQGSIYGVVSDKKMNFALKAPKQSSKFSNLFFVGGSVNPGGGMPMVILSGQNAAKKINEIFGPTNNGRL